jgi:hypothetical protein
VGTVSEINNKQLRFVSGLAFGLISCLVLVYCIEAIGHLVYPLPQCLVRNLKDDIEILQDYVNTIPLPATIFPLLSYLVGGFVGGFIANKIARRVASGLLVGCTLFIMNLIAMKLVVHPLWYVIVSSLIPIPSALLGAYVGKYGRREYRESEIL